MEKFVGIKEASSLMGISRWLLYKVVANKEIRSYKIHTKIVLSTRDIEAYMKERCIEEIDWDEKVKGILG